MAVPASQGPAWQGPSKGQRWLLSPLQSTRRRPTRGAQETRRSHDYVDRWAGTRSALVFSSPFPHLSPRHPSECQRDKGQGGLFFRSVGWAGGRRQAAGLGRALRRAHFSLWSRSCSHFSLVHGHGHVHTSPDKGGTGLWELLAPASLATAKDLGAWFCLSRSPAPTIDRPP